MTKTARYLISGLAVATLLLSAGTYYHWRKQQSAASGVFDRVEFRDELSLARISVARANDPLTVRERAIRGLLASQLAFPAVEELAREERVELRDKSEESVQALLDLSEATWRDNPSSWVSAMGLGAGRFLEGLRSKTGLQQSDKQAWLAPLLQAQAIAPRRGEVEGYFALAYLEVWGDLSPAERRAAQQTLKYALHSQSMQDAILPRWIQLQHDYEELVSVLPELIRPWKLLVQHSIQTRRWRDAQRASQSLRLVQAEDARNQIARAVAMLHGGESFKGTYQLGQALSLVEVGNEGVPLLIEVVRTLPPGPIPVSARQAFARWLDWSTRHCVLAVCPIPDDVLRRLALSGEPDSPARATAAVLTGQTIESSPQSTPAWSLYWLYLLGTQVDGDALRSEYQAAQVDQKWRSSAAFVYAARKAGLVTTTEFPSTWTPAAWFWDGRRSFLPMYAQQIEEVNLRLIGSTTGGFASIWLDGEFIDHVVVGDSTNISLPLSEGPHLIEVERLGGQITPGSVAFADR